MTPTNLTTSELLSNELLITCTSYDGYFDTVAVEIHDASPSAGQKSLIPARLLWLVIQGYSGEPLDLIGNTYRVSLPV